MGLEAGSPVSLQADGGYLCNPSADVVVTLPQPDARGADPPYTGYANLHLLLPGALQSGLKRQYGGSGRADAFMEVTIEN